MHMYKVQCVVASEQKRNDLFMVIFRTKLVVAKSFMTKFVVLLTACLFMSEFLFPSS